MASRWCWIRKSTHLFVFWKILDPARSFGLFQDVKPRPSRSWLSTTLSRSQSTSTSPGCCHRGNGSNQPFSALMASFDFSNAKAWDKYYEGTKETGEPDKEGIDIVTEWHSSIPLERITSYISLSTDRAEPDKCLIVGCGISELPSVILNMQAETKDHSGHDKEMLPTRLILQDSSPVCIERLRNRYGSLVDYSCGDATKIQDEFDEESLDFIVDKGLMDAIFCGDGWEGPVEKLLQNAAKVLKPDGIYLLVGYRLSRSSQEFLEESGGQVGLTWEFDIPPDTTRSVGISIASRKTR